MKSKWIIGIDEVGRGPLAGPVYLCGCAMKVIDYKSIKWQGLNDSKKLTPSAREVWYEFAKELKRENKLNFVVVNQTPEYIDKYGISLSISKSITQILNKLKIKPSDCQVLLDGGLYAPKEYKNQQTIIRGDQKKKIISLASVVAKVSRDSLMEKLGALYPEYKWGRNKGYGTKAHIEAILEYGITPQHRMTYLNRILDKKSI